MTAKGNKPEDSKKEKDKEKGTTRDEFKEESNKDHTDA
jgi:hypothetical protein